MRPSSQEFGSIEADVLKCHVLKWVARTVNPQHQSITAYIRRKHAHAHAVFEFVFENDLVTNLKVAGYNGEKIKE